MLIYTQRELKKRLLFKLKLILKELAVMSKIYGYCRISTSKQNIERQVYNINREYPTADIRKEVYTGTKIQGRKELDKLLKVIKAGDTIVFDSVSRMSRNADDGVELYFKLYNQGVNLVFLKERTINTENYKKALEKNIALTGTKTDIILKAVNEYLMELAKEQIIIAFEQAQKEVDDLHERVAEGIREAKKQGKAIGREEGRKYTSKKSVKVKELILKHCKTFGNGNLNDIDTLALINGNIKCSRVSYYKFKNELKEEQENK